MKAKDAIDELDAEKWRTTSAKEKLMLLNHVQKKLQYHLEELVQADCNMKKISRGNKTTIHIEGTSYQSTAVPFGYQLTACINLYKSLVKGKMPVPKKIEKVAEGLYDVTVFPNNAKDAALYFGRTDKLRVKGEVKQINPLDKKGGIIGILGAGNFSSPIELLSALFLENCAVVHKPHHINIESDKVWEKILTPLVDFKALSFCDSDDGRGLVKDFRLTKIFFTGGVSTAKAIMASSNTEFVSECGGNNPYILVPGKKPWNKSQINHHVIVLATAGKLNGGAVCGRPQTIVTCKNWPQRREFLDALQRAIEEETPGDTTYYPNSDKVLYGFKKEYPNAKIISPENSSIKNSEFMIIENIDGKSYATNNEAFCQILSEVALDTEPNANEFLKVATDFCNNNLMGTLACTIIIDKSTEKEFKNDLNNAVAELEYGAIGINVLPPMIWLNPYLTWGGNEEGKEFASGSGNFGNVLNIENVEKSIAHGPFQSFGQFKNTNKSYFFNISKQAALYAADPSWCRIAAMSIAIFTGRLKSKDF